MQILIIFFGILLFSNFSFSQNFVPYSSFEFSKADSIKKHGFWFSATTAGTPDFRWKGHTDRYFDISRNNLLPRPAFGIGYAGIYLLQDKDFREYLQIKLKEPLQQGKIYSIEINTRTLGGNYALKNIGIHFSKLKVSKDGDNVLPLHSVLLETATKDYIKDSWTWVCGSYKAFGGEQYIVLGNFLNNLQTKIKPLDESSVGFSKTSYYLFDSIIVEEVKPGFSCPNSLDTNGNKINILPVNPDVGPDKNAPPVIIDTVMIKEATVLAPPDSPHIYFETGSITINASFIPKLDNMLKLLSWSANGMEIIGYADNTGSATANKKISYQRAKAVADYFVSKGINRKRFKITAMGSKQPAAPNNSETGRALNRRVELEMLVGNTGVQDVTKAPRMSSALTKLSELNEVQKRALSHFSFTDITGKKWNVQDLKGKIVLFDFWETWCGPCKKSMPVIDSLAKQYPQELIVFAVTPGWQDTEEKIREFAGKHHYNFQFGIAKELAKTLKIYSIPVKILLDTQGNVIDVSKGGKGVEEEYKRYKELIEKYKSQ